MPDNSILLPSSQDKIMFSNAVRQKLGELAKLHFDRQEKFDPPRHIREKFAIIQPMHNRYKRGKYLHSKREEDAEIAVANWILETTSKLTGVDVPIPRFGF